MGMTETAFAAIGDGALLEEARRAAAAAGTPLAAAEAPIARKQWVHSSVTLLDTAAAVRCAQARLPRRSNVIVVNAGEPGLAAWQAATAVGADQVLGLPQDSAALVTILSQPGGTGPGDGHVVTVVSGRGGAGGSTLAAAIALAGATRHFRPHTLLVDGDSGGGGADLLLGAESAPGLRWPALSVETGRVTAAALYDAIPTVAERLHILACGRDSEPAPSPAAVDSVLTAGCEAGDLVVCDAARAAGAAEVAMVEAANLVVLIVPADLRSVAAARQAAGRLLQRNAQVQLVVRGPSPGGLTGQELSAAIGLPLLSAMRPQPALARQLERGGLRAGRWGPLPRMARTILGTLAQPAAADSRHYRRADHQIAYGAVTSSPELAVGR